MEERRNYPMGPQIRLPPYWITHQKSSSSYCTIVHWGTSALARKIDIELEDLLKLQHLQPNEDVVLSLVDKKGNPNPAQLSVRVTQDSASTVAGDAIEQLHMSVKKLPQSLASDASDAFTGFPDTLSNQQNLIITSFGALMNQFAPLIKIGDVAKVHPYVNFAWQVLSAGMRMVQAQQARDGKILDLVKAMENTHSFTVSADELKKSI